MSIHARCCVGLALLAGLLLIPRPANAETFHTCAGFIDSLPATISTQGVWCLRHDLSTAITSGSSIVITTNNVTIDCNDFKLGGLAGGAGTNAYGIYASNRLNATIRHCNVRGFKYGLYLSGSTGGGHVVEDNSFDGNTYVGLQVEGDGSAILRNRVNDTGGTTSVPGLAYGIATRDSVDVLDNTVNGVLPNANSLGNGTGYGIFTTYNSSGSISGNRVRGVTKLGTGTAQGIYNTGSDRVSLDGNHVIGDGSAGSIGLRCQTSSGRAKDNIVNGFATSNASCSDAGGNSF